MQAQDLKLRGFSDISYLAASDSESSPGFSLGEIDLYMTSELNDRTSFLGEIAFEYDDHFIVDVERAGLRFLLGNRLNVVVGRHHTPIGIWNTEFHHGLLLQPTISRPLMFLFEDQGGVLATHDTGVWVWGALSNKLAYDVMVGNGIGADPVADNNASKSLTLRLTHAPKGGLRVGASAYFDHVAAGTETFRGLPDRPVMLPVDMKTRMVGSHVDLQAGRFEMMGELLFISNRAAAATTRSSVMYAYVGYRAGSLTPYVRYDRLAFAEADPYLPSEDRAQFLVGLRHDIDLLVSARLELRSERRHGKDVQSLAIQIAFGF